MTERNRPLPNPNFLSEAGEFLMDFWTNLEDEKSATVKRIHDINEQQKFISLLMDYTEVLQDGLKGPELKDALREALGTENILFDNKMGLLKKFQQSAPSIEKLRQWNNDLLHFVEENDSEGMRDYIKESISSTNRPYLKGYIPGLYRKSSNEVKSVLEGYFGNHLELEPRPFLDYDKEPEGFDKTPREELEEVVKAEQERVNKPEDIHISFRPNLDFDKSVWDELESISPTVALQNLDKCEQIYAVNLSEMQVSIHSEGVHFLIPIGTKAVHLTAIQPVECLRTTVDLRQCIVKGYLVILSPEQRMNLFSSDEVTDLDELNDLRKEKLSKKVRKPEVLEEVKPVEKTEGTALTVKLPYSMDEIEDALEEALQKYEISHPDAKSDTFSMWDFGDFLYGSSDYADNLIEDFLMQFEDKGTLEYLGEDLWRAL